ncbi:MAG: hypothetical protein HRT87_12740 [Legionellales bacterium]|nr:hypothetical protein [Legionellales bacterium]
MQSGIKTDEFEEKIKRGDELRELSEKSEDALGTLRGFILEFVEEPQKHMFSRKRGWGTRTTTRGLASDMVRYCLINDIANNANSLYAWDKLDHVDDGSYTYQRRKYNKDGKLIKRRVYVRSRDDKSPKYGKTMGDTLYHDDENIMGITKAFEAYTNGLRHVMFDRLKQTTDVARSTAGGRIFKKTLHENIAAFSITGITSTFVGSLVTFGVVSGAAVTVGIAMLSGGVAGVIVAGIAALGFYFHRRNRRKKEAKYGEFEKKYSEALNGVEVDLNNMKSTDKKKQKIGVFGVEEKITNIVLEKADLQSKTQGRLVEEPYMRLDIKDRPELQFDITETLKKFI